LRAVIPEDLHIFFALEQDPKAVRMATATLPDLSEQADA
jgi:hypothetical protein